MTKKKETVEDIKKMMADAVKPRERKYISTGCWLVNLALSDNVDRGIELGSVVNLCGDSGTGKSLLCGTLFGKMAHNDVYDDYSLIYDDAETGFRFPDGYFGPKTHERMQVFNRDEEELAKEEGREPDKAKLSSETVEDLDIRLRSCIEEGKPFIYVMDSMDKLTSNIDNKKAEETLEAYEKDSKITGTFGLNKNKYLTSMFARNIHHIHGMDSVLFLISQSKKRVDGKQGSYRSGGVAMKYYSDWEAWLTWDFKKNIKKTYRGKEDVMGSRCQFAITKSRMSGKPKKVTFSMMNGYGIDNIRTSIEWLQAYGYKKELEAITPAKKSVEEMVLAIEDANLEMKLKACLQNCWTHREEYMKVERKPQF